MSRSLTINTHTDRLDPPLHSSQRPRSDIHMPRDDSFKQSRSVSTVFEEDEEEDADDQADLDDLDDDDLDDDLDTADDDSSTFTSSPSIPDSNIDFDLVYALHTFVATVEGQASVVKGDNLTLLDDSNSYWWLVRVLKTTEVGYIPAENIETPYERLARLNKHRNVEMTSPEQLQHYVNLTATQASQKKRKKVAVNKEIYYQSQIILVGEDEEEAYEEEYEEWEGDMDDDATLSDTASQNEHEHVNDTQKTQTVAQPSTGISTIESTPTCATTTITATGTGASSPAAVSVTQQGIYSKQPDALVRTSSSAEKERSTGALRRLFSRGKRDKLDKRDTDTGNHVAQTPNTGSGVSLSTNSSDDTPRDPPSPSAAANTQLTVLRVFAGNINVSATFNTVLVDNHTSADQLLKQAMDRFRILETGSTQSSSNGVEYYLTVKAMEGDEITLAPQDKPLAIFQSLTAHLTTPMPSLTHIKQLSQEFSTVEVTRVGVTKARQRAKSRFGEDSVIRFYLHKRIKRVNERDGQLYVKISYCDETPLSPYSQTRSSFSAKALRRKKNAKSNHRQERMDKLVAVPASILMSDLTSVAIDKFHLNGIATSRDRFTMSLVVHENEYSLNASRKLSEVLNDGQLIPKGTMERLFVLRRIGSKSEPEPQFKSRVRSMLRQDSGSPRSSSVSKIVPEPDSKHRGPSHHDSYSFTSSSSSSFSSTLDDLRHPKSDLGSNTQQVLKRLDVAILSLENDRSKDGKTKKHKVTPTHNMVKLTSLPQSNQDQAARECHHSDPKNHPNRELFGTPQLPTANFSNLDELEKELQNIIAAHAF
ncbi:uncharacterized protein BYT42DRAFT_563806 [Radiomyces spectabilis]|uniref:uncharacterized protein n=1 Tax=Radiomyces spectabilis TaxID=64574 RepID=UPI00221EA2DB|nr:uncharacterized protein BYT42DRAFT_563806 [Radiomyces spectabilis]KAI8384837.1 hypothetical protein BYT42DRAFT_563806 [Radiomyces spectabilis]